METLKKIVAIKTTGEKIAADVNGDGVVNSTDAVELYNYIEQGDAGTASKADFDVNDDNLINSSDVVAIFNYIVSEIQINHAVFAQRTVSTGRHCSIPC